MLQRSPRLYLESRQGFVCIVGVYNVTHFEAGCLTCCVPRELSRFNGIRGRIVFKVVDVRLGKPVKESWCPGEEVEWEAG